MIIKKNLPAEDQSEKTKKRNRSWRQPEEMFHLLLLSLEGKRKKIKRAPKRKKGGHGSRESQRKRSEAKDGGR